MNSPFFLLSHGFLKNKAWAVTRPIALFFIYMCMYI